MPVLYKDGGIIQEHMHTRNLATIFDVSHMGNIKIFGKDRHAFLEKMVVADVQELKPGHAVLSVIMNDKGGIIDDTIITNMGSYISMIVNGACKHKDWKYFNEVIEKEMQGSVRNGNLKIEFPQENALIAIQGPKAAEVFQEVLKKGGDQVNLAQLGFLNATMAKISAIGGDECMISRCGYTGEDGFEISVPQEKGIALTEALLNEKCGGSKPIVRMAGLGCRDTLRLEAGLCLYGHELNEGITPIEGQLAWTFGKRRKIEGGYYGFEIVKSQMEKGVQMKRCGFVTKGMAAREQEPIWDENDNKVGFVTSGTHSPCLKHPIGMAYVQNKLSKVRQK